MAYSIELDCAPGTPRPSDLIGHVIQDTGMNMEDFITGAPFFGCQMWKVNPDAEERYKNAQPMIKARVVALYNAGVIRYGSW